MGAILWLSHTNTHSNTHDTWLYNAILKSIVTWWRHQVLTLMCFLFCYFFNIIMDSNIIKICFYFIFKNISKDKGWSTWCWKLDFLFEYAESWTRGRQTRQDTKGNRDQTYSHQRYFQMIRDLEKICFVTKGTFKLRRERGNCDICYKICLLYTSDAADE